MRAAADAPANASVSDSLQLYARLAGALGLVTAIAGGFGEAYVPGLMLVGGDAAATADRILGSEALFRWGFAAYVVEAMCDATLTMLFWALLRPVHRDLAMLMVVLRIISTCGYGAAQVLYFGALPTLLGTKAATPESMHAIAYSLLRTAAFGGALFSGFYGSANIVLGWLVHRSGYLPRVFGPLIALSGLAFVAHTFLVILVPARASGLLLASAAVAFIPLSFWLLVKGVDARGRFSRGVR